MRRQRERHRSTRVREPDARARETIERRRDAGAEAIGAERIDRHEQDIGVRRRALDSGSAACRSDRCGDRQQSRTGFHSVDCHV